MLGCPNPLKVSGIVLTSAMGANGDACWYIAVLFSFSASTNRKKASRKEIPSLGT